MSHRPVNPVSPDHPRWSVLDSATAKYMLVDIGLERDVNEDGNVHNRGFGDWDGMIFHFRTRFDKEAITLLRHADWTDEQVIQTMDSYIATFQTLNTKDSLESYDFDEAIVDEIIAWPPVPSGQMPSENEEEIDEDDGGGGDSEQLSSFRFIRP